MECHGAGVGGDEPRPPYPPSPYQGDSDGDDDLDLRYAEFRRRRFNASVFLLLTLLVFWHAVSTPAPDQPWWVIIGNFIFTVVTVIFGIFCSFHDLIKLVSWVRTKFRHLRNSDQGRG